MSESTPPLRLSNETNVRMPLYLLLGLLALVGTGMLAWGNVSGQVAEIPALKSELEAHAVALKRLDVMTNDITWIKLYLEREQRQADRARNSGDWNSARNNFPGPETPNPRP